jgi:beta-galactosidase
VFRDVAEVGERLAGLDAVVGTTTPADVALVYDWHIRWALDDMKGMLQQKTEYARTVIDHYQAFWQQGVPVDVIDGSLLAAPGELDQYRVLVAPMLYMLRPGVAEAVEHALHVVQRGGTFVATYASGYVDENDRTFLGGFPGPLRDTLGVWAEEIDALYEDDRNAIAWNGAEYEAFELCELIHAEGAEVLGAYGADFYAGRPALTVNRRGEGQAYFIAARTGADFLTDFYRKVVEESGVERALDAELPAGVTAQVRSDGERDHVFVLNCNPTGAAVGIDGQTLELGPHATVILERPRKGGNAS